MHNITQADGLLHLRKKQLNVPLVFITDASLQSWGETIMDMVDYYKLGVIVGTPTAGCNGNVTSFTTPIFTIFHYTGLFVNKLSGEPLYNIGILPDYYVENKASDIIEEVDQQLNRAIEIIQNKK